MGGQKDYYVDIIQKSKGVKKFNGVKKFRGDHWVSWQNVTSNDRGIGNALLWRVKKIIMEISYRYLRR